MYLLLIDFLDFKLDTGDFLLELAVASLSTISLGTSFLDLDSLILEFV